MADFQGVPKFPKQVRSYSLSDEAVKGLEYLAGKLTTHSYSGNALTSRLLEAIGLMQLQVTEFDNIFDTFRKDGYEDAIEGRPEDFYLIYTDLAPFEAELAYKRGYMEGVYKLHCNNRDKARRIEA